MNQSFCEDYVEISSVEDSSVTLRILSSILLVLGFSSVLYCYLYFLFNYKKYEYTKTRNIFLLSSFTVGLLTLVLNYCVRNIIGSLNYSCRAYSLLTAAQAVLILQVTWVRLFSLLWRVNYNKALINQTYLALTKGEFKQKPGSVRFVQLQSSKKSKRKNYYADVFHGEDSSSFFANSPVSVQSPASYRLNIIKNKVLGFILFDLFRISSPKKCPLNIRIAGVFASPAFASALFIVLIFINLTVFLAVEFSYLPFGTDCVNCEATPVIYLSGFVFIVSVCILAYGILRVLNIYDSFGIRKETIVLGGTLILIQGILFPLSFVLNDIESEGIFDFSLITVVHVIFVAVYTFPYQIWAAKRVMSKNVAGEQDEELLLKLINTPEGKQAFSLYLACSLSLENLFFYEAATNWKELYPTLGLKEQQASAEEIYSQFLSATALLLINVSDSCKLAISKDIENGLNIATFDAAIATVWNHMASDIFPRFKKTAYYKASRNEIQNVA